MSKANGRGRGWARKGWGNLSASTQKKYARVGIDATRYGAGYKLSTLDNFARDQEKFYGRDADEVKEELREYDPGTVADAVESQRLAQELYNRGDISGAHALWEQRDQDLPEWMNFYHSFFS